MDNEARGISLSDSLSASVSVDVKEEKTIFLRFIEGKVPEVVLTGLWGGRDLQGAIKAIEKQYKLRKLTARRDSLANRNLGGE
jgi:hypothetical protein